MKLGAKSKFDRTSMVCVENLTKQKKNALLCLQEGPFFWRIFPPKTPLTLEVFDRAGIIFFL